jgi:hypothetical protein
MESSSWVLAFRGGELIRSSLNTIKKIITSRKRRAHFELALISLILSSIPGTERKGQKAGRSVSAPGHFRKNRGGRDGYARRIGICDQAGRGIFLLKL